MTAFGAKGVAPAQCIYRHGIIHIGYTAASSTSHYPDTRTHTRTRPYRGGGGVGWQCVIEVRPCECGMNLNLIAGVAYMIILVKLGSSTTIDIHAIYIRIPTCESVYILSQFINEL